VNGPAHIAFALARRCKITGSIWRVSLCHSRLSFRCVLCLRIVRRGFPASTARSRSRTTSITVTALSSADWRWCSVDATAAKGVSLWAWARRLDSPVQPIDHTIIFWEISLNRALWIRVTLVDIFGYFSCGPIWERRRGQGRSK
jgi:hypothetical protein